MVKMAGVVSGTWPNLNRQGAENIISQSNKLYYTVNTSASKLSHELCPPANSRAENPLGGRLVESWAGEVTFILARPRLMFL